MTTEGALSFCGPVFLRAGSVLGLFVTLQSVACQAPLCPWDFLGRNTEWIAISSSRGASRPRDRTCISCTPGGFFTH